MPVCPTKAEYFTSQVYVSDADDVCKCVAEGAEDASAGFGADLDKLICDAYLPDECRAVAVQWCREANYTKIVDIIDRLDLFCTALQLKPLEKRRLQKVLPAASHKPARQIQKGGTNASCTGKRALHSQQTLGRVRFPRACFTSTLATVYEEPYDEQPVPDSDDVDRDRSRCAGLQKFRDSRCRASRTRRALSLTRRRCCIADSR